MNTAIREIHPFNNKELRLVLPKSDASVLDYTGIQYQWYVDIFPLHKNTSSVDIGTSVLMIRSISMKLRDMKITRIVPNTNLLKYLTPPLHSSCNIFVEHKLNHVSFKFKNHFKDTTGSIIIIGNKGGFQLMSSP